MCAASNHFLGHSGMDTTLISICTVISIAEPHGIHFYCFVSQVPIHIRTFHCDTGCPYLQLWHMIWKLPKKMRLKGSYVIFTLISLGSSLHSKRFNSLLIRDGDSTDDIFASDNSGDVTIAAMPSEDDSNLFLNEPSGENVMDSAILSPDNDFFASDGRDSSCAQTVGKRDGLADDLLLSRYNFLLLFLIANAISTRN